MYHRRADKINASLSIEQAVGGMHSGDGNFGSDAMFVSRLGRKSYIGQFCWKFEMFR